MKALVHADNTTCTGNGCEREAHYWMHAKQAQLARENESLPTLPAPRLPSYTPPDRPFQVALREVNAMLQTGASLEQELTTKQALSIASLLTHLAKDILDHAYRGEKEQIKTSLIAGLTRLNRLMRAI